MGTMKSAALLICCLGAVVAVEGSGACPSSELREYVPVGDKCYSVPGLPFQTDFYTSSEFCSVLSGDLFHVVNRSQWVLLTASSSTLWDTPTRIGLGSARKVMRTRGWCVPLGKNLTLRPSNSKKARPAATATISVWPSSTRRIWVATSSSITRAPTNTSSSVNLNNVFKITKKKKI